MSLSAALRFATAGLEVASSQSALVARNITNAGDPAYTRKSAAIVSLANGAARIASIERTADAALLEKLFEARSVSAAKSALAAGLERLHESQGELGENTSPSARLGSLLQALQLYEAAPGDDARARNAVQAAASLATAIRDSAQLADEVRREADREIASSVTRINELLSSLSEVNREIVGAPRTANVAQALDTRDRILTDLSQEIGIKVIPRDGDDIVVTTDSGLVLFETSPRSVSFVASPVLVPGSPGNAIYVDGVAVTGASAPVGISAGRLLGLVQLRDEAAPAYARQLDELARGLVEAFAETDQSAAPALPAAVGLFTYDGAPAVPAGGWVPGLALSLAIHPAVDPATGGDPARLRDGGINGAAYVYNASQAAGFSQRLESLIAGVGAQRSFDGAAGLGTAASLTGYAAASIGWLQGARQEAAGRAEYAQTLASRAQDALQSKTGVNIDEEMALMLELERSYQATAKIIATVDQMLAALLAAVSR